VSAPIFNARKDGTDFPDADGSLALLSSGGYFPGAFAACIFIVLVLIRVSLFDVAGAALPESVTKASKRPLTLSALGGCVSYLRELKLDKELVSQQNFSWCVLPQRHSEKVGEKKLMPSLRCRYDAVRQGSTMVLDGATLTNLDVLQVRPRFCLFLFVTRC
jgi:hypothetical protein